MVNSKYISSTPHSIEFRDVMDWIAAIDAWDYCDGSLLAILILEEDIPTKLKPIIADIFSGVRVQKKKAASFLKISPRERMYIAQSISINLGLIDVFKTVKMASGESLLEWQSDRNGIEPIESKRWLEKEARQVKEIAAKDLGVSIETIENLLRDFRYKLDNYPNV